MFQALVNNATEREHAAAARIQAIHRGRTARKTPVEAHAQAARAKREAAEVAAGDAP